MDGDALFHVTRAGERIGKMTAAEVLAACREGRLAPGDLCWRKGMPGWTSIGQQFEADIAALDDEPPPLPGQASAQSPTSASPTTETTTTPPANAQANPPPPAVSQPATPRPRATPPPLPPQARQQPQAQARPSSGNPVSPPHIGSGDLQLTGAWLAEKAARLDLKAAGQQPPPPAREPLAPKIIVPALLAIVAVGMLWYSSNRKLEEDKTGPAPAAPAKDTTTPTAPKAPASPAASAATPPPPAQTISTPSPAPASASPPAPTAAPGTSPAMAAAESKAASPAGKSPPAAPAPSNTLPVSPSGSAASPAEAPSSPGSPPAAAFVVPDAPPEVLVEKARELLSSPPASPSPPIWFPPAATVVPEKLYGENGLALLKAAAAKGHAEAMLLTGLCALNGDGMKPDVELAVDSFRRAAVAGNLQGQLLYAEACIEGRAMPKDLDEGRKWLEKAAAQGSKEASTSLVIHELRTAPSAEKALPILARLKRMGEAGDSAALAAYAGAYLGGDVLPFSYWNLPGATSNETDGQCKKLLETAARAGRPEAIHQLSALKSNSLDQEFSKDSREWVRRALATGHEPAIMHQGKSLESRFVSGGSGPNEQPLEWYLLAGNRGWTAGLINAARILDTKGTPEASQEALACYRRAAAWGDPAAQGRMDAEEARKVTAEADVKAREESFQAALEKARSTTDAEVWVEARKQFQTAALQGHHKAALYLALMCREGVGGAKDEPGYSRWIQLSAHLGETEGQTLLGTDLANHHQRAWQTTGKEWLDKAIASGSVNALFALADSRVLGLDYEGKLELLRKAADRGHARAIEHVGICYNNASGVAKDLAEAARLYQRAAELGEPGAAEMHADNLQKGDGVKKNLTEAIKWHRRAGEAGSWRSLLTAYEAYKNGIGVKKDPAEALRLLRIGATQGWSEPQAELGIQYYYGELGVKKDSQRAIAWLERGVANNGSSAMAYLGVLLSEGTVVKKDEKRALELWKGGADRGSGLAQALYAMALLGGPSDSQTKITADERIEALKWFLLAVEFGETRFAAQTSKLKGKMTFAQIAEAEKLRDSFKLVMDVARNELPVDPDLPPAQAAKALLEKQKDTWARLDKTAQGQEGYLHEWKK